MVRRRLVAAGVPEVADMLYAETIRVALGALRANKLRSILTMLGIVIGVGAVIAMDGIGRGAQESIKDRITALGTTLLTVTPGQVRGMGGVASEADRAKLTMDDAAALEEQARELEFLGQRVAVLRHQRRHVREHGAQLHNGGLHAAHDHVGDLLPAQVLAPELDRVARQQRPLLVGDVEV